MEQLLFFYQLQSQKLPSTFCFLTIKPGKRYKKKKMQSNDLLQLVTFKWNYGFRDE